MSEKSHGRDPIGSGSSLSGEADKSSSSLRDYDPSRWVGRQPVVIYSKVFDEFWRAPGCGVAFNELEAHVYARSEAEALIAGDAYDEPRQFCGLELVDAETALSQGIEARQGRDEGSACESPVAEGHAPDLKAKSQESEESAA